MYKLNLIKKYKPRIAKARAAALFTRGLGATVKRKSNSRNFSEVTRMRRLSKQNAKFPTVNKADLCTCRKRLSELHTKE